MCILRNRLYSKSIMQTPQGTKLLGHHNSIENRVQMATNQSYVITANRNVSVTTNMQTKKNCMRHPVKEMVLSSTTKFSSSLGVTTVE